MSIISWNYHGVAAPATVSELHSILYFEHVFHIEPRGLSGGLCLLWNEIYNINIYFWSDNHIKARIDDRKGKIWECNFIYGNPCFGRRKEQWRAITVNNNNKGEPQLFIGDFNDILSQEEKIGLHPKPQSQVREFRKFVDMNYLMDLDIKGGRFTWFGNPRNGFITRERIDRALVNWEWRVLYQQASLKALPAISSDHCPLVLDINQVQKIDKSFKFEAFWTDHEECEDIVRKGWEKEDVQGCAWKGITTRMENCKEELRKWSRRTIKRADKEIHKLKEELKKLQDSDLTQEKQEKTQQIKENIATLWKQEEKYWGQRARLKWLKWGDKNTSFFHATTIQRRGRNRIEKLRNEAGSWIEDRKEIMKHIEERFDALFTSSNNTNCESVIRNIPVRVTESMNRELISEVTEEEIRKAVFSMGSLKAPGPDGLNGLFYQKHWEIIKKEVCAVVNFFGMGSCRKRLAKP
ncbi:uncharacterized protein LOC110268393 [Arachis ipaensis]|uniref:uncharacterized protein LOC110268393 n=1 Tax=Arachis ipaensis TaxID=130454 RepID=UPI000A2B3CBA|nr:uncharacterized protein LOC110268393 [Arachis ipaensis]